MEEGTERLWALDEWKAGLGELIHRHVVGNQHKLNMRSSWFKSPTWSMDEIWEVLVAEGEKESRFQSRVGGHH